jgi:2-phosphosulfolactate phosphatase
MKDKPFIHVDWFIDAVKTALNDRHVVVIVDTLRFSSAVVTAVAHGFTMYPVSTRKKGIQRATSLGAVMAGKPPKARYSISPLSYIGASHDTTKQVVLYSPNGAACAELVKGRHTAYIGCLLNAQAVGRLVSSVAREKRCNVTVIAAGEQQAIDTGERIVYIKKRSRRVFAVEDYLGCGAIIASTSLAKTAEAIVCERAFKASQDRLEELLLESFSGTYLVQNNRVGDVKHAAQLNYYDVVPVVHKGKITGLPINQI